MANESQYINIRLRKTIGSRKKNKQQTKKETGKRKQENKKSKQINKIKTDKQNK